MTKTIPELNKIKQIIQSSDSDFCEHEEYAAALSHWLQNPHAYPPS
jgi:hypothetical protein